MVIEYYFGHIIKDKQLELFRNEFIMDGVQDA